MKGDAEKYRYALKAMFQYAVKDGLSVLEVNAGKFHREMGGYPGPNQSMPTMCGIMKAEFSSNRGDVVVSEPPKGKGASLTIRYSLPR